MKVAIFGSGYVGLVQAAVLAESGNDVVCVDVDAARVALLQRGEIPIYEPGLEELVHQNAKLGRLRFTTDAAEAVVHAQLQFIAVGTPPDEDGSADLRHVLAVAETIADLMDADRILVAKSTVPVGTCDEISRTVRAALQRRGRSDLTFSVVSNPEFLKEGSAVADCHKPDRIILGVTDQTAENVLRELYEPFNRNHEKIMVMDVRSAEMTKYAANCMLATKISFMNEMANLADRLGADIEDVRRGIGADQRIGYHFIYPGIGFGGSCFPKDVQALGRAAAKVGYDATLMAAVEAVNTRQKAVLFDKIAAHFGGEDRLAGKRIALWGLAFKPNTDDMREAPSRVLLEALWAAGAHVSAHDPGALGEAARLYGDRADLRLVTDKYACLDGADALAICTEWPQFRSPDFDEMADRLSTRVIFDGRNIYAPERLHEGGWTYYSIGRAPVLPDAETAALVV